MTCTCDGSSCSTCCDSETESESGSSSSGSGSGSSGDDSDITETMNSKMYGTLPRDPRSMKKSKNASRTNRNHHNMRDGRDGKMKSTTSNHLRTMVIHDTITADLFEDVEDDDTYTDPSIPCSGSTNDNVQGHQGHGHRAKQDNRTMIVHESE